MNRRVDIVGGTHQDHGPLQVAEQLAICIEYLQIKLFKPINLNFIGEKISNMFLAKSSLMVM